MDSPEVLPEISPEQLALESQAGALRSYEQLVRHFEKKIFNFLFQMVRNRQDAEDLAQETFVKAFHSLKNYNQTYPFATWLYTIAKRTGFDFLRKNRRRDVEIPSPEEADNEDPSAVCEKRESADSLWETARRLKPAQFQALWLHYGEGFDLRDTARIMEITQIHAKVLLFRARNALAKRIGGPLK